jgi:hypothetical protein
VKDREPQLCRPTTPPLTCKQSNPISAVGLYGLFSWSARTNYIPDEALKAVPAEKAPLSCIGQFYPKLKR